MNILTKQCLNCGKIIIKQPTRSLADWKNRTKYCSKECFYSHSPKTKERRKRNSESHQGNKHSLQTKEKMSEAQSGKNHSQWKGEKVGYYGIHNWLHKNFGKASKCENPNCFYPRKGSRKWLDKPWRYEWSLRKGKKMIRKRENFIQLCVSCHRKYDSKS